MIAEKMKHMVANSSAIRAMFEEGNRLAGIYGAENVYDFSLGNPNVPAPEAVKEAIKELLEEDDPVVLHGYTNSNSGYADVRAAVAESVNERFGTHFTEKNIVMTVGAAGGLNVILKTLLNPGDEVIAFAPYFGEYRSYTNNYDGVLVEISPNTTDFQPKLDEFEQKITPKTKAIIVNSPCNPTGAVMSEADVRAIAEVVKKYNLWVFSDEPYDAIVYDGVKAFSMAEIDEVRDHVVVLNSFSKTYAMTGWRVGFLLMSDPAYIKEMAKLNEGLVSCVSSFSQVAAAEALSSNECVKSMVADYTRRRDILVDGINAVPGFTCAKPKGSFYAFVNIKAFGKSSQEFAEELIRGAHVICVPGTAFGAMGEGYLRLVFANSDENLEEAVRRIDEYVRKAYPDMK